MEFSRDMVVPAARSDGLVVEHLAGETLIYDLERDEAHHLNPTAAAVFEFSDGRATVDQLAARAAERLGQPMSNETICEAVEQLGECGLLAGTPQLDGGVSRREVVRKAALVGAGAAVAGPVIKSIVAPTPAMAQSPGCTGTGQECQQDSDCCESNCEAPAESICFNGQCGCRIEI